MTGWMAAVGVRGLLVGVALLALLVVAGGAMVRWLWRLDVGHKTGDRARAILREGYARGEIGREEFETKGRELM